MKCPQCSAEAPGEAVFCQQCGAKLGGTPSAGTAAAPGGGMQPATLGRRRSVADVPEETLWEGRYSPKAMLGSVALAAVATIALVAGGLYFQNWIVPVGIAVVLWMVVVAILAQRRLGIHYKMTNQMFYDRRGVMTRTINRIEAIDIDDVTWQQGLLDRVTGVGDIKISSRDRTDPVFWVRGIENVEQVAHLIDKARRAERLRRGFMTIEQTSVDAGG
jgi:membrane protein YdbS with pleckstrin-like domain